MYLHFVDLNHLKYKTTIDSMAVATAAAATAPISQKTHDSVGAADLEKVTDYAPEKEISGDVGKVYS